MAQMIDGRAIAEAIRDNVKKKIQGGSVKPGLAIILVGNDPASHLYVRLKENACRDVGIHFEKYIFPETEPQENIVRKIQELNARHDIHAILVQLPLPAGFDEDAVIRSMDHRKDVDGFHPANIAAVLAGTGHHPLPVLIRAVMRLVEETRVPLAGKTAVILGNSDVFMKPLGAVLKRAGAEVTWTSPEVTDWQEKIKAADLLVVAVGRPWMVTPELVKEGALIIDIGTTRDAATGKLQGDVHPDVANVAAWMTPVPGGVGPVTVAMLLLNVYLLAAR